MPDTATVETLRRIETELRKVIVGQEQVIEQILVALLAGGHVLIEGVPGLAKTLMVRSLAQVLGIGFRRIQFTPDLMPADVIGTTVFNPKDLTFEVKRGPVFTNLLLADEINRTPPKTQSALLEAMEEQQVTLDGQPHPLPRPFMVIATQNPIEYEGTYPLPEAQLDRFLMKVRIDYPAQDEERAILENHYRGFRAQELEQAGIAQVLDAEGLLNLRTAHRRVTVEAGVLDYINAVVRATREWSSLSVGASPRGAVALLVSSQSLALLRGRDYVVPDDVKEMARPVLRHRVILRPEAEVEGVQADQVLEQILQSLPVPR
ncbi:MoxR-like ATPase [Symbiobacterium terraclitae]|uniref:MoxR-like ATPase n=1 Tax=Symbiobacterium terraclitae TaxID=557451 RepID=A0ABS4JR81_9FIRM|nr:MoxR family ATPase [Symbiobacterium terraclitae]MBP2017401.1 MoxR-like ATPase [Symbiobacterium terraclitae]